MGGRGVRGGLAKDHIFSGFSFVHPSLKMFVSNKSKKYLLKDSADIRAGMKGSANQDENKPVRLQSPSDALFTKVWVAC